MANFPFYCHATGNL